MDTQLIFISHSFGDWEGQDQGTDIFGALIGPTFWFIDGTFLLCPHMVEGGMLIP
jgi:hypothetical protein